MSYTILPARSFTAVSNIHNILQEYKILVFHIMGPCYLIGSYRDFLVWMYCIHMMTPVKIEPEWSSSIFKTTYQTIRCPNLYRVINSYHCEDFKSCTKKLSELKCGWRCHSEKTELKEAQYVRKRLGIEHQMCTLLHSLPLKETEEASFQKPITDIISTITHVRVRTTYYEFIPQG